MSRNVVIAIVVLFGAFVALVVSSSFGVVQAECEICVTFQGRSNCATASAASPEEATRSAQTAACATISGGVTDGIACGNARPTSKSCKAR